MGATSMSTSRTSELTAQSNGTRNNHLPESTPKETSTSTKSCSRAMASPNGYTPSNFSDTSSHHAPSKEQPSGTTSYRRICWPHASPTLSPPHNSQRHYPLQPTSPIQLNYHHNPPPSAHTQHLHHPLSTPLPSPGPTRSPQYLTLPPRSNTPTATLKEWESAYHNFRMQEEASLDFAHSKKPPTYSPNKDNSYAFTRPSDTKSLPRLQPSRPPDTSGALMQVTAAKPGRSTSTLRKPPTMANSSMTNGTNTPITVNSAGTKPLDESKYTP